MSNITIYLPTELERQVRELPNMSQTIRTLLVEYLNKENPYRKITTEKIIKETAINMKKHDELEQLNQFINNMTDEQKEEFFSGRKENTWSGIIDYARQKQNAA